VERLQSIEIQLQQLFNDRNSMQIADRLKLMNKSSAVFADVGTTGWGLDGDNEDAGAYETQHTSVADLRQQQQRMVQGVFCLIFEFSCSNFFMCKICLFLWSL
jgi:hypothetical protein